ncbi:hypothetical protein [Pseudoxanthomonas sacheonensis]|uniref:Uncharacterized protein n=1 Tax=Pseudoxanthomonas sacheonensis TaxID=443615 RepID=A0ABU1RNN2_9GAMM|nr:hypothetical protein [Pseudoxanthomonas sacheonensis]MDR6840382.1 hypothetical protein [Pseudoxanthomonas sacheonensis]
MKAGKQLLILALWGMAQFAVAQVATENGGYGPIVWPKERQHELAGHYAGTLRDHACENMIARLALDKAHHYVLTVDCSEQGSRARTLRGDWWIDEIAGSCLILNHGDGEEKRFGFRISDDANLLSLDGSDCNAADERDSPHGLKRTGSKR